MRSLRSERGFTIIELMVGLLLLSVGVAGTAAMLNGANATTSRTKGREGGTNLVRSVTEIARSVSYRSLTGDTVVQAVAARPGMSDVEAGTPGLQVLSRDIAYTVAASVCSMDDPKDGLGNHRAGTTYCTDSQRLATDPAPNPQDRNPDDYRRVRVTLTWRAAAGRTSTVTETAIITNPVGGLGASVSEVKLTAPTANPITSDSTTTASFQAKTSQRASSLEWSVNGDRKGQASGDATGTSWTFDWEVADSGGTIVQDGTYVVTATGFDEEGRSGTQQALTVVLNRVAPAAPTNVEGGRNGNGSRVDVEWHTNPEGDIAGYRVYRGNAPGQLGTLACPASGAGVSYITTTSCLDEAAPAVGPLYYTVVALDRAPDGSLREGTPSESLEIVEGNAVPTAPTGLTACTGGVPGCDEPDGQTAPSGTTVLTWDAASDPDSSTIYFYRVYRDGEAYSDRYDRLYPTPDQPLVFVDTRPGETEHTYRVSAVDKLFGESPLSAPVTR